MLGINNQYKRLLYFYLFKKRRNTSATLSLPGTKAWMMNREGSLEVCLGTLWKHGLTQDPSVEHGAPLGIVCTAKYLAGLHGLQQAIPQGLARIFIWVHF